MFTLETVLMTLPEDLSHYRDILLNKEESVAHRTQVSFWLRTHGSVEAVHILAEGFCHFYYHFSNFPNPCHIINKQL